MLEGPRGTGKSFPACVVYHQLCSNIPDIRLLIVRQTLKGLRESVQTTYETRVLAHESDDMRRFVLGGKSREHRTAYYYPNRSQITLGGLDNPDSWLGADYDGMWFEEARQINMRTVDTVSGNLRNGRLPGRGHFLMLTTNPGQPTSALNTRFPPGVRTAPPGTGARVRLLSRHEDNPTCSEEYLERLRLMTGADYRRLYLGEWYGEEGQVWPQYDEGVHVENRRVELNGGRYWLTSAFEDQIELEWFGASMDFGYRHAGVLGVWGVARDGRSWLVGEVYHTGWQERQWADAIEEIHEEYPLDMLVADSEDPRFIDYLNYELTFAKGAPGKIVFGADKSKGRLFGLNAVRKSLDNELIHFLPKETRMRHWPDKSLKDGKPTCSTDEILGYVFADPDLASNEEMRARVERDERPAQGRPDDGCDMIRYWCTYKYADWEPGFTRKRPKKKPTMNQVQWVLDLPSAGEGSIS